MANITDEEIKLFTQIKDYFKEVIPYREREHENFMKEGIFVQKGAREEEKERHVNEMAAFKKVESYLEMSKGKTLGQLPDSVLTEIGRGMRYLENRAFNNYTGDLAEEFFENLYGGNEAKADEIDKQLQAYHDKEKYFKNLAEEIGSHIKDSSLKESYFNDLQDKGLIGLRITADQEIIEKDLQDAYQINLKEQEAESLFLKAKNAFKEAKIYIEKNYDIIFSPVQSEDREAYKMMKDIMKAFEKVETFLESNQCTRLDQVPDGIKAELSRGIRFKEFICFEERNKFRDEIYFLEHTGGSKEEIEIIKDADAERYFSREQDDNLADKVAESIKDKEIQNMSLRNVRYRYIMHWNMKPDLKEIERAIFESLDPQKQVTELLGLKNSPKFTKDTIDFVLMLNKEHNEKFRTNITADYMKQKYRAIGKELEENFNTDSKELFSKLEGVVNTMKKNNLQDIGEVEVKKLLYIKDRIEELIR